MYWRELFITGLGIDSLQPLTFVRKVVQGLLRTSFTISLTRRSESSWPLYAVLPFRTTRMPQPFTSFPSATMHPATIPLPLLNTARTCADPTGTFSYQRQMKDFSYTSLAVKIRENRDEKQ